jgi:hypothetical protein
MALTETIYQLEQLILSILKDLVKVNKGNKTAAQRVRTRTIHLEKVAKDFRKESMDAVKTGKLKKKKPKPKPKKKKRA